MRRWQLTLAIIFLAVVNGVSFYWHNRELEEHRERDRAHNCATFLNIQAVEKTLIRIAQSAADRRTDDREQGFRVPPPRLILTDETRAACKEAGIPLRTADPLLMEP